VRGVPAADGADEAALHLLRHLARTVGVEVEIASGGFTTPGTATLVHGAVAVLVVAIGPGGLTEARYLCRRLRGQHPEVKILVGRWGCGRNPKKSRRYLLSAGAFHVAPTMRETQSELVRLGQSPLPLPAHQTL
jgi:hypothetical protein